MAQATVTKVDVMGMPLDEWKLGSCVAHVAAGEDWATVYDVRSSDPGKGHATALLTEAKARYEAEGKKFGGSVALNERMKAIYQRVGIHEYC